jgi:dihydroorotase
MADLTIINSSKFRSKSRNCPFAGWKLSGRADVVIVGGIVKFTRDGQLTYL